MFRLQEIIRDFVEPMAGSHSSSTFESVGSNSSGFSGLHSATLRKRYCMLYSSLCKHAKVNICYRFVTAMRSLSLIAVGSPGWYRLSMQIKSISILASLLRNETSINKSIYNFFAFYNVSNLRCF